MRTLALLLALPLTACGPGRLAGAWSGSCDFSDGDYGEEVFLDLALEADLGRRLEGEAAVTVPSEGVFEVPVVGEHTLTAALLEMTIPAAEGDLLLSFEGSRDADELEGPCELWVPGASAAVVGRGELSR